MVSFVWEFVTRADKVGEFEKTYANSGPWVELFRKNGGYDGTLLLRDAERKRRYLTIDRWHSTASQREMRERFAREHEELDPSCDSLTESERRVGIFEE
jgi:hypothetical protein